MMEYRIISTGEVFDESDRLVDIEHLLNEDRSIIVQEEIIYEVYVNGTLVGDSRCPEGQVFSTLQALGLIEEVSENEE